MAATPDDVRTCSLSGEFDAYTDGQIQPALDKAARFVGEHVPDAVELQALLAAHLLYDAKGGGGGKAKGHVIGERFGPMSRSYATKGVEAAGRDPLNLSSSGYGRQYLALLDLQGLTPNLVWEGA